jgi:hypothetical protein
MILCEGADEERLFLMLRKERGLTELDVEIVNAGGRENIQRKWSDVLVQSGGSGIRYVAVVLDSEDDPKATHQWGLDFSARNKGPLLDVDVFQIPATEQAGSLETLIRQAIPPDSVGSQCATQWELCAQANAATQFATLARKDKAWLQVWLTHRTTSTASSVGYAIANDKSANKSLRQELNAALAPLQKILDSVLGHPCSRKS